MPNNYKTIINFRDGIQVDADDLISQNGLVGIGTTIPREQLDVRGNIIVENETNLRACQCYWALNTLRSR